MRLSVIVPCRNGEAFLAPTLESVLNQSRPPDELIFVDDGSTDGSLSLARSYGDSLKAISGSGDGACAARNRGAEEATGDAIMFLDADDLLGPNALATLESALEDSDGSIACCPWHRYEKIGECWVSAPASCRPRRAGQDDLGAWLTGWYHPPCSVLWSRDAYERTGGWDSAVKVNNDGDIMMRGFVAGNRLTRTEAGAAYYRRLPDGRVSLSGTRATRTGIESRLFVLRRLARLLEERGRLGPYRGPLGEAFAAIVADCRPAFPDLYEHALCEMEQYAGSALRRRAHRLSMRLGRKMAHLQRRAAVASGSRSGIYDAPAPEPARGLAEAKPEEPTVSVIVPTYNRADLLQRALDSVFAQTYRNFELIVIDDASTDNTDALLHGYPDPRLRVLRQPSNRGVAASRNWGMREATGPLIAFLDSDDEWFPQKLAHQVARFAVLPESVGLIYCAVETVDSEGNLRTDLPAPHSGYLQSRLLLNNFIVGGSCAMIRRSVLATAGYFDETLPAIEDYDFWLRIARFYAFDYLAEPLVRYFDPVRGDPERDAERRSRNFMANFRARHAFYERNRHEMERAGVEHLFLLESARRHLKWPFGDQTEGRHLAFQAASKYPTSKELYPWLAYALLPPRARNPVARGVRRVRDLAAVKRPSLTGNTG